MQYLRPIADVSTGSWSTPALYPELSDVSDATFIQSAVNNDTAVVTIETGLTPGAGTKKLIVRANKHLAGGGGRELDVELLDSSSTLIQSFTTAALTDTITQYEFTVTNSIASYSGLRIRIINQHTGGVGARISQVHEAWLEVPDGDPPPTSCPISLLDQMDGADPGGTWEYLGYTTDPEDTPSIGVDDPNPLSGDNPEVDFEGFVPGFHHFEYCGGSCEGCEILIIQIIPGLFCSSTPADVITYQCDDFFTVVDLYDFLGISNTTTCKIISAESIGTSVIDSGDITVNSSVATVDLTGYGAGGYRLLIRFANVTAFDLEYDLQCESCYAEAEATFILGDCTECNVEAGTGTATEICNNEVDATIALLSRMTGTTIGGEWSYLGYSATEMGTPGGGGSTPGALTGDNPVVDFFGFTVGWYSFEYCVENEAIEDCVDCGTLKIEVIECPCDVTAGTGSTSEICGNNEAESVVNLRSKLTDEDSGGSWEYIGYSTTEGGSYAIGSDDPGPLTGDNPSPDLLGFTAGFHKFRYCVTDPLLVECEDCEDIIIEVTECDCDVDAGTAEADVKVCNENDDTTRTLRNHLTGEDAGGVWTYIGYSVDDTTYGAGGSAVGSLTGDNPTKDFDGFILGFYKFRYCVTDPEILECTDCEDLIIEVVACPCSNDSGTALNKEICN